MITLVVKILFELLWSIKVSGEALDFIQYFSFLEMIIESFALVHLLLSISIIFVKKIKKEKRL